MQTVNRLIEQFIPENYHLSLTLEREARKFSGLVSIKGATTPDSSQISLHAKDLAIGSINVNGKVTEYAVGENDELIIAHPDIVGGKPYVIDVAFSGQITDAMHGLYPCYFEVDGEKKELLATQFESHHAREVFPCIDEPAAKATFDVTLTTEQDVAVLGNMPVKLQREEDERLLTIFETTPRMSSYLLAFVVGDLHKKSGRTKGGVEVNIWATKAQPAESLDFALDIATRSIDFYNDYFGTDYPLPKSDHVALPDFSSGAMENWGLITYREVALLADPKATSVSSKHYIATVIAHELSHQWFGNLVTMKWWNDLWLNESFADLMEYLATDALEPSWNMWLDFSTTETLLALRRDSLDGVQSVQTDVHHPDDISTLFDGAIVYAKGGRLLRMLQHFIGTDAFRAGLKSYFKQHAYGNTEASDLWQALSDASGQPIGEFMTAWISQSGFPVVHVDLNGDNLSLHQEQFFVGPHEASTKLWPIPLNATDTSLPKLLEARELSLPFTTKHALRLNVADSAHFITHYSPALMERILKELRAGKLSELDRLQLLDEQVMLARGEVISNADLLPLIREYKNETSESVWDILGAAISELRKFVETNEVAEKKLRALAGDLATHEYDRLGWNEKPGESESDTKLRAAIIAEMIYSERDDVIQKAIALYHEMPLEDLNPELRALILSAAVRYSNEVSIIDDLLDAYRTTSSSELQHDLMAGLTSTKDPHAITLLLELTKDKGTVRPQDAISWYVNLLRNRYGRTEAWQWLRNNWPWVMETFSGDKSYDYFPRYAASSLISREQLHEYREFFGPMLDQPSLRRTIEVGLTELEGRVSLIEAQEAGVQQALLEQ